VSGTEAAHGRWHSATRHAAHGAGRAETQMGEAQRLTHCHGQLQLMCNRCFGVLLAQTCTATDWPAFSVSQRGTSRQLQPAAVRACPAAAPPAHVLLLHDTYLCCLPVAECRLLSSDWRLQRRPGRVRACAAGRPQSAAHSAAAQGRASAASLGRHVYVYGSSCAGAERELRWCIWAECTCACVSVLVCAPGTAWHACEFAQVGAGDTVAIWGLGPIGTRTRAHSGSRQPVELG
jgi:hypothetical protein